MAVTVPLAAGAPSAVPTPRVRARIQSVDLLRGIVMVIMAIDHVRDFLHNGSQLYSPEDLAHANLAVFLTRWVTHFCAPVFVFLAGTGSWLAMRRGMSVPALSRFLWTRGLWLVVVEMTFVLFAGTFNLSYRVIVWQVIWAIGWSMAALSLLVFLPWRVLLIFSLAMIGGHNLLDPIRSEQLGSWASAWKILHEGPSIVPLPGDHMAFAVYPLIPWIGVMSAGFCFGRVFDLAPDQRRRFLMRTGLAMTCGFLVLRFLNIYGDPSPWSVQSTSLQTVLSFLRVSKYPPSLMFLLVTLGPALIALSALERLAVSERNPFLVFGRVPLFYYVLHWYAIHLTALGLAWMRYGRFDFIFEFPPSLMGPPTDYPPGYGYDLWIVYLIWLAIVATLYPICRWFAGVKARNRSVWLSYL